MPNPKLTYLRQTFLELGDGFHFSCPPPTGITDESYLRSDDPWEVLACVLARLQQGELEAVDRLVGVMRRQDGAGLWNACAQLIGFAGRRELLESLANEFAGRIHERGVQFYVSSALVNGCGLWSVPHLLAMHSATVDDDTRIHIELGLSRLIETEPGPVWSGPAKVIVVDEDLPPPFRETSIELNRKGYAELVETCTGQLRAASGPDDRMAIAEGQILDLNQLTRILLRRIRSSEPTDRIEWERMIFEATTGVSCREFFDPNGILRPLAAAAIIEDFLESGDAKKYESGARYFFGHKIPD